LSELSLTLYEDVNIMIVGVEDILNTNKNHI